LHGASISRLSYDGHVRFEQFDCILKRSHQNLWLDIQRINGTGSGHSRHDAIADHVQHINQIYVWEHWFRAFERSLELVRGRAYASRSSPVDG